ncbi:hypothetical protein H0H92_006311 [Tricholoma furcatifolium]|nr:hypothetical protein H0H92_006311 [Tricholoma furcatifolium]
MTRFKPIGKLFASKTDKSGPPGIVALDVDLSVPSRGANVPTKLGIVNTALQVANTASAGWPAVQSIISVLQYFITNHEAWLKNETEASYLLHRLQYLEKSINEGGVINIHEKFIPRLQQLDRDLQGIKDKSMTNRYLATTEITTALNGVVKDIGDVVLDYQTSLQEAILHTMTQQMAADDLRLIQTLPRARDAHHLSEKHRRCLPGTRRNILFNLNTWAHDRSARTVYWLNGHAGSGKTCRFPDLRFRIVETLRSRPDVAQESLNKQLEALLIEPLEQSALSTLIVIDALDECKDDEPVSIILSLLSRHIHRIPQVKWFITGRPEPLIRQGFRTPGLKPITETFILHDVTASDVDKDISLYLATRLSEEFKERSRLQLPEIWPPDDEIQALTAKCERLFIFASTAVAYIKLRYHNPAKCLSSLCRSEGSSSEHGRLGLDQLYTAVLEAGYRDASSAIQEDIKTVIASVVLAFNPIPIEELAVLLDFDASTIIDLVCTLHAVLRVPQRNDRPIMLYHKSFFDYITDASRCTNPRLYVDPSIQHAMLVDRCLQLMNLRLRRNPCSLPRYAMNADLELPERQRRIGGALEYACSFWVAHLTLSKISPHTLHLLEVFLKQHLIHWLEVMSLINKFPFAIKYLHETHDSLFAIADTSAAGNVDVRELLRWVYDEKKLASEFRDAAQVSASHLYHTALALAPEGSILRNAHSEALEFEPKIINGNIPSWPPADMSITIPPFCYYAFSRTGKFLAVMGKHRDVHLYDVTTGEHIEQFRGEAFCFSSDDAQIAIATGFKSARIYDLRTGTDIAIKQLVTAATAWHFLLVADSLR